MIIVNTWILPALYLSNESSVTALLEKLCVRVRLKELGELDQITVSPFVLCSSGDDVGVLYYIPIHSTVLYAVPSVRRKMNPLSGTSSVGQERGWQAGGLQQANTLTVLLSELYRLVTGITATSTSDPAFVFSFHQTDLGLGRAASSSAHKILVL